MKKKLYGSICLLCLLIITLCACGRQDREPSVIKTYDISEPVEEGAESDDLVIMVKHYEMSDGTWKAAGFSSNMDDYFKEEDPRFVAMR